MKIKAIQIENLRSFKKELIQINDYTCIVGPNGAGKSNILCALNIFFRENEGFQNITGQLEEEDFHHKVTDQDVKITLTFTDLSEEAKKDFADYYRQEQLVVSAIAKYDKSSNRAEVKQFGQRLALPAFSKFFAKYGDGASAGELKEIYSEIRKEFPDLPTAGAKEANKTALNDYEAAHKADCELIESDDEFYGVSRGKNLLEKYIQWVYIPAVKDAATEQTEARNSALGKLLERTVRSKTSFDDSLKEIKENAQKLYGDLLEKNQSILDDISKTLGVRVAEWSHPDANVRLEWCQDPTKSITVSEPFAQIIAGEGKFEGNLSRFGHGLQRSYILALLQELANCDSTTGPRLVLGCEEPELYQHPPQARHLSNVFQSLSQNHSQILICTHSPYFAQGDSFEDVRVVKKDSHVSSVTCATFDNVADEVARGTGERPAKATGTFAKVHQALQPALSEMFFTQKLILVEGLEDVAYITTYMNLMNLWDDYRRFGCHMIAADGKSHMIQPIAITNCLGIDKYAVFDSDGHKPDKDGSRTKHEKDNKAILKLCGINEPIAFPADNFSAPNVTQWKSEIGEVVEDEIGKENWKNYSQSADQEYGQIGGLKKNSLHIGKTLTLAWEDGNKSDSLERLCAEIISFAKQ